MTPLGKQKLVRSTTNARILNLVEITYKDTNGTLQTKRYTNTEKDITYNNNVFESYNFTVVPSSVNDSSITDGTFTLSVVDRLWTSIARQLSEKPKLHLMIILEYFDSNNVSVYELLDENTYTLSKLSWNDVTLTWTMVYDDKQNVIVPCDIGTVYKIPALG